MKTYLVGGAVRDELLDLPVYDRDWVVVGASEQEMLDAGFIRADAEFPVFIHPQTGEEYALARTERKAGPGYKGFEVYAGRDVSLEQDLLRRDLTINALARDESGALVDVCNGREDLDEGLLRHITPAFIEDPVRLLRIARFTAKLGHLGFRVAHGTHGLMKKMAASDELLTLKPERVYQEMWKALAEPQPWRFFEVLQRCGALQSLLPEVAEVMGETKAHQSTAGVADPIAALQRVVTMTGKPPIRFVVMMYAAARIAGNVDQFIHRLRAGKEEADLLRTVTVLGPKLLTDPEPEQLIEIIHRLKPDQRPDHYTAFNISCRALWPEQMQRYLPCLELARQSITAVSVRQLQTQGLQGAALGAELKRRQVHDLTLRLKGHRRIGESC